MIKPLSQQLEEKAGQIITVLDGISFIDQMSVLIGLLLSHVLTNLSRDAGEQVIASICGMLPHSYTEARALLDANMN